MSTYEFYAPSFAAVFSTPFGPITVRTTENQIISLQYGDYGIHDRTELLLETASQLNAYFSKQLKQFQLPLLYTGTAFQKRVWAAVQSIPFGSTISYRELAQEVGSPLAYRAVGNANGKNPLPILIPCHRVIAHDGSLGGYSGGIAIKNFLLSLEQPSK